MEHYVGLDVSLKLTAICIVDRTGKIEREGVVSSDPEAIAIFIKSHAPHNPTIRIRRDRLDGSNLKMRRCDAANLPLRGRQCAAHPHRKVVGAQSLGHQACEAKRTAQSQGRRGSKACRHSAPDVDRAHRIQMVVKGGCQSTCIVGRRLPADQISGNERPCRDAGVGEIALGLAMLKRANRASHIDPPASSNAIMRRARPYCGENPEPGKDVTESLTPRPELENDQDPTRKSSVQRGSQYNV